MTKAFQNYDAITKLNNVVEQHRAWLRDYEGLPYSIAYDGEDKVKWKQDKEKLIYSNSKFSTDINKIQRHPFRLVIEFDDKKEDGEKDLEKIKANLQLIKDILEDRNWGYIESTHKGVSNYVWVEFNRKITDKEAEKFLKWIAPIKSEIDLNFASSNFRHPVLFAIHWKHSENRETPVRFFEGNQIDYDDWKKENKQTRGVENYEVIDGFKYKTFNPAKVFTPKGQAEVYTGLQPLFYDRAGNWWLWENDLFKWKIVDEVDILNMVEEGTAQDIISPKQRTIILNSLKQEGRKKIPQEIEPTWIQFKDIIFDIGTGEKIKATPDFFVTNPIPWKLNEENIEATPVMDKIFEEWVGKDFVKTLYEIIAYCLLPDYPMHRLFCFIGPGMNGKSCFLRLMIKFIGESNTCSTELDTLLSSRFEVTRLFKKLVCIMGETNFSELNKTSMLKKLTGQDVIGFEHKNKNPFEGKNYAKILISTNNLPETTDKTIGFYRRWLIVDFPNSFSEQKDILKTIPDEEYGCLALKCCTILKDLLEARKFTNEGSIEDRAKKYEEKSDPISKFIQEQVIEDGNENIGKADFEIKLNNWCKSNRFRQMSEVAINKKMKELNIFEGRARREWWENGKQVERQVRVWMGVKWRY